jgi:hypothetical protein
MSVAVQSERRPSAAANGWASGEPGVVPGRSCGTCTLCCKVAAVEEVAKPMGVWCPHCRRGTGCAIYASRPPSCRTFYCQWMLERGLGDEWKPERAKFALVRTEGGHRLTALVDPGYPAAWRRSPYYENLRQWAVEAAQRWPDLHLVDVMIGAHCIVLLPDREVDIGTLAAGEGIRLETRMVGPRRVFEVCKVSAVS